MKVFGAKVIKEGVNSNTGKAWSLVSFTDERGRKLSSFDTLLLDLADGSEVDGAVTETQKGDQTYYNFKMSKDQPKPLQTAPIAPQKASSVPQDVWDKKDLAILAMNCNNSAAQVYSGTSMKSEHMAYAVELFEMWDKMLNGKKSLSKEYAKVLEKNAIPPESHKQTDEPDEMDLSGISF